MKFGGTSMAGTERIRRVASIVRAQAAVKPDGTRDQVAVVVSAMAGETDRLVNFCREANPLYDPAEYDVVVASGEQVTSGLLALTLQALGCKSRSWLGWQLPIHTIEAHAKARVESIDADALIASMEAGEIAVIPGFQGVSADDRITTLGRGGSDTSAVAVAAAIKADRCDIYTDVDGVYTTDPRIVAKAKKQKAVTYEEMLELASVGAKVLQTRSVGLAMKEKVRVQVLSSFIGDGAPPADDLPGTMIVSDEEMDELAKKATETFDDLMDLGMNVDSRYASEIFSVAGAMLGHALTAKTAKLNKKLKMVDLQLKKLKMDQDQAGKSPEDNVETAHGQVLSRNDLLERLMNSRDQNNNKA
jgi:aspartate kinase